MKLTKRILNELNPPFPYISPDEDGRLRHFQLTRYSAGVGERQPMIPGENVIHSIYWFAHHMWGNATMPFVHGDMTESNVIFNPPYLFVIDFEPGLIQPLALVPGQQRENSRRISSDLIDFLRSVKTSNRHHNRDYTINHLFVNMPCGPYD